MVSCYSVYPTEEYHKVHHALLRYTVRKQSPKQEHTRPVRKAVDTERLTEIVALHKSRHHPSPLQQIAKNRQT